MHTGARFHFRVSVPLSPRDVRPDLLRGGQTEVSVGLPSDRERQGVDRYCSCLIAIVNHELSCMLIHVDRTLRRFPIQSIHVLGAKVAKQQGRIIGSQGQGVAPVPYSWQVLKIGHCEFRIRSGGGAAAFLVWAKPLATAATDHINNAASLRLGAVLSFCIAALLCAI